MADPRKALEILEKYYATVTPEQFKEDVRRATPQGESQHEQWGWITLEKTGLPTAVGANASISRRREIAEGLLSKLVMIFTRQQGYCAGYYSQLFAYIFTWHFYTVNKLFLILE